ncbi:TRAP transporter small permease [Nisaea sediminum]|uniref:TRAP transporter small permease n=1 Tax=Nisaea sediminum TaxID=2775867 RepID=UPI0018678303|nr:TRAP transporter small permease [Nisaea sediminum]
MTAFSRALRAALAAMTIGLLVTLAIVVVSATVARYVFNSSFVWYDEVAGVLLAWITFYGSAYAATRRRHLGFDGLVISLAMPYRAWLFALAELIGYVVFAILAYAGWFILQVMGTETLISLPWMPLWFTQSVVPVGAVLFMIGQAASTPEAYARIRAGRSAEMDEIDEEIAHAKKAQGAGDEK